MYRDFQVELAKRLKTEHGSRILLVVRDPNAADYYRRIAGEFDPFDDIEVNQQAHPTSPRQGLDEAEVLRKTHDFEARYGKTFGQFAVSDRHFGRGFAPGGYYHPRSRQSETFSYIQFLDAYNAFFEFWEKQFREKEITLLIDGGGREAAVARATGALHRTPSMARYKNRHLWTTDEFGASSLVDEAFAAQPAEVQVEVPKAMPFIQVQVNQASAVKHKLSTMLRRILSQSKLHLYLNIKGMPKAKSYYWSSEVRFIIRQWRSFHRLKGRGMASLEDLKGETYVYYPLHVEPEVALQGRSPEYFVQLASIISTARDLPAGIKLAVKEHLVAVGRRPDRFYDQICELKNVVLLDVHEQGLAAINGAAAVVTINGTGGQEAAVQGIPVIAFGRHNTYNILPHVFTVEREEDLASCLAQALSPDFDRDQAKRNGERFLAAVEAASFDMGEMTVRDTGDFNDESVASAHRLLLQSLP
jgi:hypothetical protein